VDNSGLLRLISRGKKKCELTKTPAHKSRKARQEWEKWGPRGLGGETIKMGVGGGLKTKCSVINTGAGRIGPGVACGGPGSRIGKR